MEEKLDKAPEGDAPATPRGFQFTLGGALGATAWMALFFALISLALAGKIQDDTATIATVFALPSILYTASATLFSGPLRGLAVGAIAILSVLLSTYSLLGLLYIAF